MFKFEYETVCMHYRDLDPMSINSVLAMFRLILFAFNHILRFSKSGANSVLINTFQEEGLPNVLIR